MNAAVLRATRLRFGDLAEPIIALRAAGRVVAPFNGAFRVNDDVVDAEQLCALADRLKARQGRLKEDRRLPRTAVKRRPSGSDGTAEATSGPGSVPAPHSPAPETSVSAPTVEPVEPIRKDGCAGERGTSLQKAQTTTGSVCRCGSPSNHGGRCWVRRGLAEPIVKRAVGRPSPKVCEKCGGPRSYWSAGVCRQCYQRKPTVSQEARIAALEGEIAALKAQLADTATKADFAALKEIVADAARELLERIDGMGEGR